MEMAKEASILGSISDDPSCWAKVNYALCPLHLSRNGTSLHVTFNSQFVRESSGTRSCCQGAWQELLVITLNVNCMPSKFSHVKFDLYHTLPLKRPCQISAHLHFWRNVLCRVNCTRTSAYCQLLVQRLD